MDRTERGGSPWTPPAVSDRPARTDTPPEPDGHFLFRVNGVPILVRGTNWVPLDAFHSRDAERLRPAMDLVSDAGCNMIRCWGGNVYESDAFFDLCDERGIMVWQDMAFACCSLSADGRLPRARAHGGRGGGPPPPQSRLARALVRQQRDRHGRLLRRPPPLEGPHLAGGASRRRSTATTRTALTCPARPTSRLRWREGAPRGTTRRSSTCGARAATTRRRSTRSTWPTSSARSAITAARTSPPSSASSRPARSGRGRTMTNGRCIPSTTGCAR